MPICSYESLLIYILFSYCAAQLNLYHVCSFIIHVEMINRNPLDFGKIEEEEEELEDEWESEGSWETEDDNTVID